jgi:lysophospholipase L1-like esterase
LGAEKRTEGKLHCHFVDLVPVFDGHPDWFADDGIHENSLGSAAMAQEVTKVLKDKCVAQPESSGCCTP